MACGPGEPPDERPRVVATTAMIGDVARALADDHVRVEVLMSSGTDPHLYRADARDVEALAGAQLVLWNGLHLEGRLGATIAGLESVDGGPHVVAVAERLVARADVEGLRANEDGSELDPHAWMDPELWAKMALDLAPDLAALAPGHAEDIAAEAERYAARLTQLDEFAAQCFDTVPEERRVLVTAHDAFGYLGRAFGFEVVGLQGISTESEAGVRRIEEVVDLLVDRRVPAVFVESSVSRRAVEALVDGARARGLEVTVGGELYSDAMGAPGTHEGTYIGMLEHNVATITRALGGEVRGGTFEIWSQVARSEPNDLAGAAAGAAAPAEPADVGGHR